ncbi:hypothetical protein ACFQ48_09800 [Hymenobacter caeli]|uniref:Uncharacterized protein n=1 Tax=Hymenobacter caeli TaxID=2735894 RepID=A0ABX2FPA2_9BACT|nr:hypothetical protein [Hymenobacter caeli]NRT18366.1 hypothetical protein [Hymenobacter caeli]
MKIALTLLVGLALVSLRLPARAQTAPAAGPRPKVTGAAAREPGAYQGPHVVKDTKALGQKFIQHSRPTDGPVSAKVLPRPK